MHARRQGLGEARQEQVHGHRPRLRQHQGEGVVVAGSAKCRRHLRGTAAKMQVDRNRLSRRPGGRTPRANQAKPQVCAATAGAALLALSGLILAPQLQRFAGMGGLDRFRNGGEVFHVAPAPRRRPWGGRAASAATTGPCGAASATGQTARRAQPSASGCGPRCRAGGSCPRRPPPGPARPAPRPAAPPAAPRSASPAALAEGGRAAPPAPRHCSAAPRRAATGAPVPRPGPRPPGSLLPRPARRPAPATPHAGPPCPARTAAAPPRLCRFSEIASAICAGSPSRVLPSSPLRRTNREATAFQPRRKSRYTPST